MTCGTHSIVHKCGGCHKPCPEPSQDWTWFMVVCTACQKKHAFCHACADRIEDTYGELREGAVLYPCPKLVYVISIL